MTVETNNNESVDDELDTTAPQSEPQAWVMPKPVFRRTSGKLPKAFVNREVVDEVTETSVPPDVETFAAPPEPKPENPALKMALVFLGLAAMIAFLIVFLTFIYFFFLRSSGET